MNLDHVFAKGTVSLVLDGAPVGVPGGSHWLADDPLVVANPDAFTVDCRYGLRFSGAPPEVLSIPPGEEDPVMTAKVASRLQTGRGETPEEDGPLSRGRRRTAPARPR